MKTTQQSNRQFIRQLFEQYHRELHRYLLGRLRSSAVEAEDVAQETYLRLLRMKDTDVIQQPHAYVYRVATHVVRELGLKEQAHAQLPTKLAEEHNGPLLAESPEARVEILTKLQQLDELIDSMPPTYRAVLIMRKQEGLSHKEIADKLDISVHTVKKYMSRALAWCREYAANTMGDQS